MVSASLTRSELEFARKLVAGLGSLPESWSLEPTHLKTPVRPGWTETTLSRSQTVYRLLNGSWESKPDGFGKYHQFYDGFALRLTHHAVVDMDGSSTAGLVRAMAQSGQKLPRTIAWSSGRQGRASTLYALPESLLAKLAKRPIKKIRITEFDGAKCAKGEAIEILLPHPASTATLPPSNHPKTDGYQWLPGASPDDREITPAPQWLVDLIEAELSQRQQRASQPNLGYTNTTPGQLWEHIQEVLATIPNDIAHDDWIKISLALKGHCPTDSEGYEVWSEWSLANGTKRARCTERNWDSFKPATSLSGFYEVSGWSGARYQAGHGRVALFKKPGTEIGLTRKPDLHIGDREFSEVADTLPKSGLVVLYGGKGTSKTNATAIMIKGRPALPVSHLTSIAREQASRFRGMFLNDANRDNPIGDVVTVCVPSIAKVVGSHEVLIIDETTAVLHFLLESKLANKRGQRPILISEIEARIREAKLVILADADLTDSVIEWVEAIRGEKAYLVESSRKPLGYAASFVDGTRHEAIAMLQQRAEQATDKLIVINTDSKRLAESLVEVLGREKCLLITADTSADLAVKTLFTSKGGTLPHLLEQGIRFVVASPSVVQGFSIEQHTDLIDSNWGFFTGGSITVEGAAQSLGRVRSADVPRFVWCAHAGSAYSKFSRALTVEQWIEDFKSLTSATARIARNALAGDVTIEGFPERQERNTKLLASLETRRNQGMANPQNGLIGLLEKEGVKVEYIKPDISPVAAKLAGQALKAAEQANDRAEAQRVAARPLISQSEADGLANSSEPLTQEQQDDLTKFYVVTFYKLEDTTTEDVLLDRKGRTRKEITFLERILNPSLALERTEQSLNKNECPQDWDSAALQIRYIELSGFGQLIRAIVAGEVETLTADLTAPIVEYVRANADEFRLLFKVSPDRISDRQIIGEILGRSGIKTKRVGNKNNHRYIIRKPELEALLAIVERRQVAVTPPQEDIDYLTGCDPFLHQWKTPECLEDIRQMWRIAANDPLQRVWLEAETPPEILRLALAA